MPSIRRVNQTLSHQKLDGVVATPINSVVRKGVPQRILVQMAPGATIPLHTHRCAATMIIVAGKARVISNDNTNNSLVASGDVVYFEEGAAHGFVAGDEGMSFITENGGIVDERGSDFWDIKFA